MDEIRFNPPPRPAVTPVSESIQKENNKRNFLSLSIFKKILKLLGVVLILAAIVLIVFLGKDFVGSMFKNESAGYSAVFLSNGQVYFGKMMQNNELEIVLNNVFYIQVNDKAASEQPGNVLGQSSFNLVKLGNELHGPTDELFINRLQVVFYEKLRDDSKVVESISNYKQ